MNTQVAQRPTAALAKLSSTLTPDAIRRGLPASCIARVAALGIEQYRILRVVGTERTLRRKMQVNAKLTGSESDRLARMVRIVSRTFTVFGNEEKALHWLCRPSTALPDGEAPIDFLDTDPGAQWVGDRLEQIAHGLFA